MIECPYSSSMTSTVSPRRQRGWQVFLWGLLPLSMLAGCSGPLVTMERTESPKALERLERVYVYSFTNSKLLSTGIKEQKLLAAIEGELAGRGVFATAINAIRSGRKAGMVVYRDHENYSDGYRMTMISTIPVAELIALHAEDEKRDRIAHRITIFPKNNIRGSLITGNEVFLGLSIFSVRGELQAIGNLRYQYRFYQDEAELAKLLIAELDRLALLPYPKQNTNAAPPSK